MPNSSSAEGKKASVNGEAFGAAFEGIVIEHNAKKAGPLGGGPLGWDGSAYTLGDGGLDFLFARGALDVSGGFPGGEDFDVAFIL